MRFSLVLVTAGCALRVISEPLAYGGIVASAWTVLPVSVFSELAAVLLFGFNLAMTLAAPIPSWFGRKQVNDRMSIYWLISSHPATRKILVDNGFVTLGGADRGPHGASLGGGAPARAGPASRVAVPTAVTVSVCAYSYFCVTSGRNMGWRVWKNPRREGVGESAAIPV